MYLIQILNQQINPKLSQLLPHLSPMLRDNILEQVYALCVVRLCDEYLLSQLSAGMPNLFEQIWIQAEQRRLICQQLSATHHIDEESVQQLIYQVIPLIYQCIMQQASKQQLSVYQLLQSQLDISKTMLPVWVGSVIPMEILTQSTPIQLAPLSPQANNPTAQESIQLSNPIQEPIQQEVIQQEAISRSKPTSHINPPINQVNANSTKDSAINYPKKQPAKTKGLMVILPIVALALIATGVWFWFSANGDNRQSANTLTTEQQPVVNLESTQNSNVQASDTQASETQASDVQSDSVQNNAVQNHDAQNHDAQNSDTQAIDQQNNIENNSRSNTQQNINSESLANQSQSFGDSALVNGTQPMSMTQANNDTIVFEFEDDSDKISKAELEALTRTQIVSENANPTHRVTSRSKPVPDSQMESMPDSTPIHQQQATPDEVINSEEIMISDGDRMAVESSTEDMR